MNTQATETLAILHVVIDPLCGWCYAAAPLLSEASKHIAIKLHGGGLFIGEQRRQISSEFRQFAISNDQRIHNLTRQPFDTAYSDDLLTNTEVVLDSAPPITALLAVKALNGNPVQLLHDLQVAYYQQGKWLSKIENLANVAKLQDIEEHAFKQAYKVILPNLDQHISDSRAFLASVGGQGFPTFVLQMPSGEFIRLNHSDYYGDPEGWHDYLIGIKHAA